MSCITNVTICVTVLDVTCRVCYFALLYLMSGIPNVTLRVTVLDVMYPECYFTCYST